MLTRVFQGADDGHAGRAADEQSFLRGQATCHLERLAIGDLHDIVGDVPVERLRVEVLPHAFDVVLVHVARVGVDGAFRIGAHDRDRAVRNLLEVFAGA